MNGATWLAELQPCDERGGSAAGPEVVPFEQVYARHSAAVYRFCLSQTGDPAVAEDVAADTFAAAFEAYARARPEEQRLRAWLLRIARNQAIDHHRRRARAQRLLTRWMRREPVPDVEEMASQNADLRRVLDAMLHLSSRDRQLLGLRLAAGLPFAEIASATGMREAAARVACHRALRRLRSAAGGAATIQIEQRDQP
jgi:RNA polymerase sigma-70 factor (ECF subfamily)